MKVRKAIIPAAGLGTLFFAGNQGTAKRDASHRG